MLNWRMVAIGAILLFVLSDGLGSETVKPLSFQQFIQQMKEDPAIQSIDSSKIAETYAYLKITGDETFELYYGEYSSKTEKLVVKHNYSAADSTILMSPKGNYFLVNRLTNKKHDQYKSEVYAAASLEKIMAPNTYGLSVWDEDEKLIWSGEYHDKYPTRARGVIWTTDLNGNGLLKDSEYVVRGPEHRRITEVFYIGKVEGQTVYYKQVNLENGEVEEGKAFYGM